MKRLVDVADLEKFIREYRCVIGDDNLLLVAGNDGRWHEALPFIKTAYDVDKVVEQLEELKSQVPEELGQLMAYDEAIKIVKAGGNIELSEHSESQSD